MWELRLLEPLERVIAGVMDGTEWAAVLPGRGSGAAGGGSGAAGGALEPRGSGCSVSALLDLSAERWSCLFPSSGVVSFCIFSSG